MTKYHNRAALLERGWTDELIKRYLPTADEIKNNPVHSGYAPQKKYKVSRIHKIEGQVDFLEDFELAHLKYKHVRDSVQRKQSQFGARLRKLAIKKKFPNILIDDLKDSAIIFWQQRNKVTVIADKNSDFVKKITQYYIRHMIVPYSDLVSELNVQIGRHQVFVIIRRIVMDNMRKQYPALF